MQTAGDALSDVLRMVQLKACIYFVKDMQSPWGMTIPRSAHGPLHMVLRGECVLRHSGRDVLLRAGDAIVLPHGATHQMSSEASTAPASRSAAPTGRSVEQLGKTTPTTRMLCGHFEWNGDFAHPVFNELPELIVVRDVFSGKDAERVRRIVDVITAQSGDDDPGSSAIADRMGEVLFVILLRNWMLRNRPEKGVLAVINDPRLSRALRYMHQNAERELNLSELARVAGMSRTAFAVRFRESMGQPPAAYLTDWRMLKARKLLLRSELPLTRIVIRTGYSSDSTFARAYKRHFGETPGETRRARMVRTA